MSDLDNEENYFTKRMNGAIKDEDVEKAVESITKQINIFGLKEPNYDTAIWLSQIHIQTILNELKYREEKIKDLKFRLDCKEKTHNYDVDMIDEVKGEVVELNKEIKKKDKIIDLMADRLKHIVFVDKDNKLFTPANKKEAIEYFSKKAEKTNG